MDTQKWGPDGWKLVHSIAYYYDYYETDKDGKKINQFYNSMKHILPCIYCRRSFKQYLSELPLDTTSLFEWSYRIHNKVNNKLRKQGYNEKPDPSFKKVKKFYDEYFSKKKNCAEMGWNFIYSIVFNYDEGISDIRKKGYLTFFNLLRDVLPNQKSREKYGDYLKKYPIENAMNRRDDMILWMYRLEKTFRSKCCTFEYRCKTIEKYRVNKCKGETCRT